MTRALFLSCVVLTCLGAGNASEAVQCPAGSEGTCKGSEALDNEVLLQAKTRVDDDEASQTTEDDQDEALDEKDEAESDEGEALDEEIALDGQEQCPWKTTTTNGRTLGCADGTTCDRITGGWNCCGVGERAKCPAGRKACNNKAGNGVDFSCWRSCNARGGRKLCEAKPFQPINACLVDEKVTQDDCLQFGQALGGEACSGGDLTIVANNWPPAGCSIHPTTKCVHWNPQATSSNINNWRSVCQAECPSNGCDGCYFPRNGNCNDGSRGRDPTQGVCESNGGLWCRPPSVWTTLGDGGCQTEDEKQPRKFIDQMIRIIDNKYTTISEDMCKADCSSYDWCQAIAHKQNVNGGACVMYALPGTNPDTPVRKQNGNKNGSQWGWFSDDDLSDTLITTTYTNGAETADYTCYIRNDRT